MNDGDIEIFKKIEQHDTTDTSPSFQLLLVKATLPRCS